MKHIPSNKLKEKKLNINSKAVNLEDIDLTELTKEKKMQTEKAIAIYSQIMEIFNENNTTIQEAYYILASILDSIYTYSVFEELGMNDHVNGHMNDRK